MEPDTILKKIPFIWLCNFICPCIILRPMRQKLSPWEYFIDFVYVRQDNKDTLSWEWEGYYSDGLESEHGIFITDGMSGLHELRGWEVRVTPLTVLLVPHTFSSLSLRHYFANTLALLCHNFNITLAQHWHYFDIIMTLH